MRLFLDGHEFGYEASNLCFLFFPGEKVETAAPGEARGDFYAYTRLRRHRGGTIALALLRRGGESARAHCRIPAGVPGAGREREECYALARAFYRAASELTGIRPPWGVLTGIRPVKLFRELLGEGLAPREVRQKFAGEYLVSEDKLRLCERTAQAETRILSLSTPRSASLYLSIPFCPSRCLYCSFISHDVEKVKKLLPAYVELLCREIEATGRIARSLGLRLETVYMGGGTPTTLEAGQLREIFAAVARAFNLDTVREYTVEAGRPDTITPEKLRAIRDGGATRVSINPQTLSDEILTRIGRRHTAQDFYRAYGQAVRMGFDNINTDLIAGLPGDTPEGYGETLGGILALRPASVTVHTLAMKRSSRLVTEGGAPYNAAGGDVMRMLGEGAGRLLSAGYGPYYLYRQRNTVGNLENVGWSLPGREGLYNVYIMDETHTILAAGAGGVTKLRQPGGGRIERIFNFKYPYEYIARFQEILDRKNQVVDFYDQYQKR